MRANPALPWSADTERGTIRLNKDVSQQDLLDGILKWTVTDNHGSVTSGEIVKYHNNKLYLNANGQFIYEIANFNYQTRVLELTRVEHTSESLVSVDFPEVIAPQGDVQVFEDRFGYKLATGTLSKVWARINNPWSGENSGWSEGLDSAKPGNCFTAIAPDGSNYKYGINLWVDWNSALVNNAFTAGQMVEVTGLSEDVTNYETTLYKPAYFNADLGDGLMALLADGSNANVGDTAALVGLLSNSKKVAFSQDGIHAIGGLLVEGNFTLFKLLNEGSYQTTSVLNTAEIPSVCDYLVKVRILKDGRIEVLYKTDSNDLGDLLAYNSLNMENEAQIGDSAPIYTLALN